MEYILNDGTYTTIESIKAAFLEGRAVLVHGYYHETPGLMIDGKHYDTRGTCEMMSGAQWTTKPGNVIDCVKAAML